MEHGKGLLGKDREVIVARLDCVIPVFHGMHGEDGTIQGLLELCNIPYASSGVGASAMGMDKVYMKQYFRGAGFPVLPSCWFLRRAWEEDPKAVMDRIEQGTAVSRVRQARLSGLLHRRDQGQRTAPSLEESLKLAFRVRPQGAGGKGPGGPAGAELLRAWL